MAVSPISHYRSVVGLTLIEVLVALAIVGIAMTAVIKAASQNIRSTNYLQNKTSALWVAQNIINEVRVGVLPLSSEESKKKTELLGREWYSKMTLTETPNKRIKKIVVQVYDKEDADENVSPLVTLDGYLYKENQQ